MSWGMPWLRNLLAGRLLRIASLPYPTAARSQRAGGSAMNRGVEFGLMQASTQDTLQPVELALGGVGLPPGGRRGLAGATGY